ncbi:MAG: glycosyltransferase [Nanoarchaeota archaeon]|nr:glycosyltransferase [Nanoarchaeota archaeon]
MKMPDAKISIIIPCKEIDNLTEKCLRECLKLDYPNYEIIVLPDDFGKKELKEFNDKKIKIIKTGKVKPAVKRNLGMEKAKGEFFAFIDSDAYPDKNWLKNAMEYFDNSKIGIVGGPNLTPVEGNIDEKISGYVLRNFWVSGPANVRYKISKKNKFVKELPSCNYISRKEISPEYKEGLLTAEDSKFCFDIKKRGYKILYAKDVIVYHHRRDSIKKHIKQMFIYGRDIAWLAKEEFSLNMLYFSLLSLFVIGLLTGAVLSAFYPVIRNLFSLLLFFYFLIMIFTSIYENMKTSIFVMTTSVVTHFAYGIGFIYGVLVKNKNEIHVK